MTIGDGGATSHLSNFSLKSWISERITWRESLHSHSQIWLTGESFPCCRSLISPSWTTGSVGEELVKPGNDGEVTMSGGDVGGETDEDKGIFSVGLLIFIFSYAVLTLSFSNSLILSE